MMSTLLMTLDNSLELTEIGEKYIWRGVAIILTACNWFTLILERMKTLNHLKISTRGRQIYGQ